MNNLLGFVGYLRNKHFLFLDVFIFVISPVLSLFLRFDGGFNFLSHISSVVWITIFFSIIKVVIFSFAGVYKRFWKLASIDELAELVIVGVLITVFEWFFLGLLKTFNNSYFQMFPYSFVLIDSIFTMLLVSSMRFSLRLVERTAEKMSFTRDGGINILIVGAGDAGVRVVAEIQRNNKLSLIPVGFIDDDQMKLNLRIRGIPVLGTIAMLPEIVKKHSIKKIIVAIPTASGEVMRRINLYATQAGIETQTLPSILEIIDGKINISKLRKIHIEDLLRREVYKTSSKGREELITGKTILISGAGGSIGSEIVRQISQLNPNKIILLGHGENSIFEIEQEFLDSTLNKDFDLGKTELVPLICDIRDNLYLENIFKIYRPSFIFHAAAHKHVPLMEKNPFEAVKNNVVGTKNLIDLSVKYDVKKFVLISSDKAVNPTNIMGATKRIAELITLNASKKTQNSFSAVRFGNVLGSRGSVVQTFEKQIKAGGPIVITHPQIKRFFMTIPEAVQLVLEAFVISKSGEIFVLDMGDPIKIVDLAKDMIRLSGLKEGLDIELKYGSLREGEKLFEELFISGESYEKTIHSKIMIAQNACDKLPLDLEYRISILTKAVDDLDLNSLIRNIKDIVPEFNYHLS